VWLTWANALTGLRAIAALPCAWFAANGQWGGAAALLSLAVLTDLLDGPLARRLGQTSPLGGLLDHATDAWFVSCLLTGLWWAGLVPWLLPALVVAAFLQYAIDSRVHRGGRLRGNRLGRWNGIGYFVVAALPVLAGVLGYSDESAPAVLVLSWLLVVSTVLSMLSRWRTVAE
jgi:phosphatidylglycerophosphate synthase